MTLPIQPIPAPGFTRVSGKQGPKEGEYMAQFRNSWIDIHGTYGPRKGVWVHDGGPWDIVAVKRIGGN